MISLLFLQKNQTENLSQYTMYTGSGNPYNLSKISLFNGKNSLGIWSEETEGATCNKVQGSDGATFNPYVRTHHMFSRILNFLFVIVFSRKKKIVFSMKLTFILAFYNLF